MNYKISALISAIIMSSALPALGCDKQPMHQVESKKAGAALGALAQKKKESFELFKKFVAQRTSDPVDQRLCEVTARMKTISQVLQKHIYSFDGNPEDLRNLPGGLYQNSKLPNLTNVPSCLYAHDGKVHWVFPDGNTIKIMNVANQELLYEIPYRTHSQSSSNNSSSSSSNGQKNENNGLTFVTAFEDQGTTYVAAGSEDNYVRLWNTDQSLEKPCVEEQILDGVKPIKIIDAHAYQKNGRTFLVMGSASIHGALGVLAQVNPWKLLHVDGDETFYMFDEEASPFCVLLHKEKKYTIAQAEDEIKVIDASKNCHDRGKGKVKRINSLSPFTQRVPKNDHWYLASANCAYENNGQAYLIVGFKNGGIAIFDPFAIPNEYDEQDSIGKFAGHDSPVHSIIQFKRNGKTLFATGAKDGSVYLWEFGPGTFEKMKIKEQDGLLNYSDDDEQESSDDQEESEAEQGPTKRQKIDSGSDDDSGVDVLRQSSPQLEESQALDKLLGFEQSDDEQAME